MPRKTPSKRSASAKESHPTVDQLQDSLNRLEKAMSKQVQFRLVVMRSFVSGMVSVLGALAAVAIVVPILIWVLRGVQWPPLVDAFVQRVVVQIEESQHRTTQETSSSALSSSGPTLQNPR